MSDAFIPDDETDFSEALTELIERAYTNGTDPEGAWKCSIDGNGNFHWDVRITRVQYDDDDD
ncbi:MAG: hypothetical protein V5A38_09235 [Halolamina sp.]|uniref:hypothetical protein n=1 Tax=Halolamina sp. TaxID=1940283 RepID=UPI002FC2DE3F